MAQENCVVIWYSLMAMFTCIHTDLNLTSYIHHTSFTTNSQNLLKLSNLSKCTNVPCPGCIRTSWTVHAVSEMASMQIMTGLLPFLQWLTNIMVDFDPQTDVKICHLVTCVMGPIRMLINLSIHAILSSCTMYRYMHMITEPIEMLYKDN